jgi:autotransporter-associated beta strand protein
MKPPSFLTSAFLSEAPSRRLLDRRLSRFGRTVALIAALSVPFGPAAWATSATWTGASDAAWADANWGGVSPVPGTGDTATFNATSASVNNNTTIDLGTGVMIGTILFDTANAAAYTIGAGAVNSQTLTLNNGGAVTMNSTVANNETVNSALVLGTDGSTQTFTLTNNSTTNALTVAGGITGSTGSGVKTLAVAGAGSTALSGIIGNGTTGTVALAQSGAGTLTLSGVNTFTGGLSILSGTLIASTSASALGASGVTLGNTTGNSAATLLVSTSGLTYSNAITLATNASAGTLTMGNTGTAISTTFSGAVTGANSLTINNSATTGDITFSNSINNGGTFTNTGSGVTGNLNSTGNTTAAGTTIITAVIGANVTGIFENSSTSDLLLGGNNSSYTHGVTVTNGTVILGSNSANEMGTGTLTLGASASSNAAGLIYAAQYAGVGGANNETFTNAINVLGIGTNFISATNWNPTFSGAVTLNSNTLTISTNNTGGSVITISGGITGIGNIVADNTDTGAGGSDIVFSTHAVNNAGTITFTNAAFNGGTAGTAATTNSITGGVGSSVTAITNNSGSNPLTISGVALTVNGGGTTLTNSNSTAGVFTVSGGVGGTGNLILDNNSSIANGITLSTTSVNNAGAITNSGTGSGSTLISAVIGASVTGVTQNSTTSGLTLSGANTFTGNVVVTSGTLTDSFADNNTNPTSSGLGNPQTVGRTVTVNNGGTLNISANNALGNTASTINTTVIINQGGLVQATPTTNNTNFGNITLNGGTLTAAGSGFNSSFNTICLLGNVTVTGAGLTSTINASGNGSNNGIMIESNTGFSVASGATLNVSDYLSTAVGSTSGGGITLTGGGTMVLSANNIYGGVTTIENGALVAGINSAVSANGAFGNASSAVALGDATSISSNLNPSLLIGGAFTVGRSITVGSSNTATSGVYTIGGNTANTSTFSGIETLNQSLTVSQVSGGTLNLTGNITSGASGTQTLTFNNAGSVSQSTGVIGGGTGTIAVTQSGAGSTTLSGANTYSGATTITAGTLIIGGAGTLGAGSYAGNISNAGAFKYSSSANQTLSGSLTGNGTLTKDTSAASTLTLSGSNNYSGATTINAGTLTFAGAGSIGSVSVADSATLGARLSSTSATVVAPTSLTFGVSGASNFAVDFNALSNPTAPVVSLGSGTLTLNGTVNVSLVDVSNLTSANNSLQLLSYASQTGAGAFNLATTSAGHTTFALNDTATALYLNVSAATNIWTGATNNTWDIGTAGGGTGTHNWSLSDQVYLDGDIVAFDDTASQFNVNIASTVSPSGVKFSNSSAHTYTLSGAGIAGSGALILNGINGTVILTNTNTYTGNTTIGSGDTLQLGDGTTDGVINSSASITDNGTLIYNRSTGSSFTYSNAISGSGALTKSGSGTQILTSADTYSGPTTINAGTLQIGAGGAMGALSGSSAITDNGSLVFDRSNAVVQGTDFGSAAITGSGSLTQLGSGSLTLNAANSFSGGVNINAGSVSVTNVGISGANSNLGTNGTINIGATTTGGTLLYTGAGETSDKVINLAGTTGGATIDQSGAGLLNITGNLTATGAGAKTLTLQGSTAGTGELASAIMDSGSGAISVTKAGTGTWTLPGNNTYSGPTTVSGGILILSGSNNNGSSATASVSSGATLQLQANVGNTSVTGTSYALGNAANKLTLSNGSTLQLRSNSSVSFNGMDNLPGLNGTTITIDVNNITAGTTNGATNGGTQNQTLTMGSATTGIGTTGQFNITGGDGYTLAFGPLATANGTGQTETFNPTSASVTIASYNNGAGASNTLALAGTSTGNAVQGAITNTTGSLAVTKSGASTWTLSGANTYKGATTISGGTLGLTGTLNGSSVSTSGTAILTESASGVIVGSGVTFAQGSSGTSTLAGNNSYTGATTVTGGIFVLSGSNNNGSSATTSVSNGATLQLRANAANTSASGTSYALGTAANKLTLSNGSTLQLRSDTSVSFNGVDSLPGLNGTTITIDVNNITAGTTNGTTNGGTQNQTLTMGSATTGIGTSGQFNITGGDGYTLAFGPLQTANGTGNTETFNPTSASVTIASYNNGVGASNTLALAGTSTGNAVLGAISNTTGSLAVTKSGASTWTLSGANTYTGATTISAGTLIFAGSGSLGSVSVADSATLGTKLSGTSASVIAPANLSFGTSGTSNFAVNFNSLSNPSVPVVAVSGALTLNGTVNVSLANTGNLGNASNSLELMSYNSQAGTGAFNLITTSVGHTTFGLNDTATALYLNVSAATNIWTGVSSNIWDIGTPGGGSGSHNWSLSDQVYLDGDIVTFDDTASQFNVNIASTVSPSGVTFSNSSAHTYTISGAGIAGSGVLTLNGANGTVILTNTNTYTGITTIGSGDTLQLGNGTTDGAITNSASITDNGTLIYNRSTGSSFTYGNAISGNGALTKSGSGTQILTSADTYSGATTISGGTLQLGNGGATGALSGSSAITDNGNLAFNRSNAVVQGTDFGSAAIAGSGAVTQLGSGSLTLNAANSFSGGVNINAGSVSVANVGVSGANSNLGTNGTINIGATTAGGTLLYTGAGETSDKVINLAGTTGGATIDQSGSGLLDFSSALTVTGVGAKSLTLQGSTAGTGELDGAIVDSSSGATSLTKAGTGTWTLTGNDTYTGATAISAGTLSFQGGGALPGGSAVSLGSGTLQVLNNGAGSSGTISLGNSVTINPATTTDTINVGNNGSNTANTVAFGALSNGTPANANIATINFTGSNGYLESFSSLALSGLTGGGTTLNPTTTSVIITGNVTNQESGSVTGHFNTLTLDGTSGGNFINGVISNSSGYTSVGNGDTRITKSNSSTWTLAGNNTYSGPTTVSGGILILSGSNNNGSTATISVSNGATLQLQANAGNTSVSGTSYALGTASNKLTLSNGSTLQLRSNSSVSFNGVDSLPGLNGLTFTIDVNNITAGTTNGATNGGTQNQTLTMGSATNFIGTTGQFNITGGDGYTLAFGPLATANGTGNTETFNPTSASVTIASYNNGVGASNTLALAGTSTGNAVLGAITNSTGSLVVTKSGASTWTLAGANTYTGPTTVNGGTLQAGVASVANVSGAFGLNSEVIMANTAGATLNITGYDTQIGSLTGGGSTGGNVVLGSATLTVGGDNTSPAAYAGIISGASGNLTNIGTGTMTLTGSNTYTGATTINSGATLQLGDGTSGDDGTIGNSSGITDNGTLIYNRYGNPSSNVTISGGGNVTISGNGSQTLTAANTYTGATTINPGATLQLGNGTSGYDGTIGNTSGVTDNGNLIFNRAGANTASYQIAGTGNVTVSGAGSQTLTNGNNNYAGTTTVNGTLIVAGGLTGNGTVTVNSGGTLGAGTGAAGTGGTIDEPVSIAQGGTLAPGALQPFAGTVMTIDNNLTLSGTANMALNLDLNNNADLLVVSGNLALDPSTTDTLTLNLLGTMTAPETLTYLIAFYGSESGSFGNIVVNGPAIFDSINYNDANFGGNAISVTLTVVPEPATWASILGGLGMLVAFQRMRRHNSKSQGSL